ncbi:MAG: EamA family transporter [Anaerolineae bacterium]
MRIPALLAQRLSPASESAHSERLGILLVVLGAFCFSLSILFIRLIDGLDAMSITFYRSLFAFLFLSMLLPRFPQALQVRRYRAAIPLLIAIGAAMTVTASLYTYAIQHTAAATAALLVNSSPLYVALLSPWLLREPRPRWTWVGLALAGVGIVLIADPAQLSLRSSEFGGIVAGTLSGISYAAPMVISRKLRRTVTGITQNWWGTGITALLLLPFAIPASVPTALPQLHLLIPLGIISLGLSYLLLFLGLQRCSAQVASMAALMEPVFGAMIGLFIFGEMLTPGGWLGAGLVLFSIYLISR